MRKENWLQTRAAGILLPVFSLPSPYGIGSFGKAAYRWVDFLAEAGQRYWQVLPLGPTGFGDSPYQSFSAFAGNPYFVDLEVLQEQGLLTREECGPAQEEAPGRVDYGRLFRHRKPLLRLAYSRFADKDGLAAFQAENAGWLNDYALYMALKEHNELRPWLEWDEDVRLRDPRALAQWREHLHDDVRYHMFVQYCFFRQWLALKRYANERGVRIIGDIPLYVAMDSADTWAKSELFWLGADRNPVAVAGVPPDAFSETGQLWGNPLYRWDTLREDGYAWWLSRLQACMTLYDALRIDHFRGLESYYAVPYGSATAAEGEWRPGPGVDFLRAVRAALGEHAPILAEDLGYLTPQVHALLRESGYPGMKVLQFAFDSGTQSDYMPHTYTRRCVVYTGTHDNETTCGWLHTAPPHIASFAREYLDMPAHTQSCRAFIRAALASVALLAVVPMQDYLELGNEARINRPATLGADNWSWRMDAAAPSPALGRAIRRMAELYGRC